MYIVVLSARMIGISFDCPLQNMFGTRCPLGTNGDRFLVLALRTYYILSHYNLRNVRFLFFSFAHG